MTYVPLRDEKLARWAQADCFMNTTDLGQEDSVLRQIMLSAPIETPISDHYSNRLRGNPCKLMQHVLKELNSAKDLHPFFPPTGLQPSQRTLDSDEISINISSTSSSGIRVLFSASTRHHFRMINRVLHYCKITL